MTRTLFLLLTISLIAPACASSGDQPAPQDSEEYTEAMAREHDGDKPDPSGAVKNVDPREVVGTDIVYATVDRSAVEGYLAQPSTGEQNGPAIIVIHEWWGLNENIRNMADQLAEAGYTALAVDVYGGKVASKSENAMKYMKEAFGNSEAVKSNLRQAHKFLETKGASQIGVIGWCFGGHWSLQTGMLLPDEIDAMVIYYGKLITEKEALKPLDMPILGIFAAEDQGIPVESVNTFETRLAELGKDAEIHIYEGAQHAFANPSGKHYDREAAEDAWAKTMKFLAENL